ncbi:MAG TPA: winged helix DNA-binding domain-containing protein [Trebonia sp.]|jgi:hypothetical protein|nr:winged helix DNA-binding domain-containing protein [Trebonia sp.]
MTVKVAAGQRRARLAARHFVDGSCASAGAAAGAMIALHATDPVTVYLSAWARSRAETVAGVDRALYGERTLVRMLGMRRTMFVVPAALVPVVQRACTDDVAARLRRGIERDLAKGGVGGTDPAGWLRDAGEGVLAALAARGSASGAELSADEPRLRAQLAYAADKDYGRTANITSRVLMLLSAEGLIVRGERRGGWSSGQFTWHPMASWLPGRPDGARSEAVPGKAALTEAALNGPMLTEAALSEAALSEAVVNGAALAAPAARAELARRWLLAFGPAPVADLQWWAGWTGAQTKAALAALPVTEADLDGQPGVILASDLEPVPAAAPRAVLLPGLDPTPMGWQARDWFLGPHAPALFDRTGNIGPVIIWDGRVVGGWAQRKSGEVVARLLEDAGTEAKAAVAAEGARLEGWLGEARVTPRFRTPLERQLSA